MILCGFEIKSGEKKDVKLPVSGGGFIDATLFCGMQEGKTLVVTAGVHGCEYNGIEALRRLRGELDPKRLLGQVVLVPLVNQSGFYAGAKQVVPEDGVNLNRAFPGDADGSASARIAAVVQEFIYPYADFLMDLHGGDQHEMAMSFAYFPAKAEASVCSRSRAAAQAISMEYRVASSAKNGLYSYAAQQGIPALLLERGGRGSFSAEETGQYCLNVYELLNHLDILPQVFTEHSQKEIEYTEYIEAPERGFWYPAVREGQTVTKGTVLGELRDYGGELLHIYHADFDGVTLYYTLALGVNAGEPLIAYGRI